MIAITGATGKLGQLVVAGLLKRVSPSEVIALVRNPGKATDLASRGVIVREADYSRPQTLKPALAGATKVLLISSSEVGQRVPQHKAVVDAAKDAGVRLLVYTSILRADTSKLLLAQEHKATEEYIAGSGVPGVFLRNAYYMENQTEALGPALQHGAILGAADQGRFASATRANYAEAAVAVLTGVGHENKTYELGGDTPYTLTELASEVSKQSGKTVSYQNLPEGAYAEALISFGLPGPLAATLADADAGAAHGELNTDSHDLSSLIGKPTTTLAEAVSAALKLQP